MYFIYFVFVILSLSSYSLSAFANPMSQVLRVPLEDFGTDSALTCALENEKLLMSCTKLSPTTYAHPQKITICLESSTGAYALFKFQGGEILRLNELQENPSNVHPSPSLLMPVGGQYYFLRQAQGKQFQLSSWKKSQPSTKHLTLSIYDCVD